MMRLWMTLCLLVGFALPVTAAVVREPYLQMVTPTSITIVWQTDLDSANDSRVQYGTGAGVLNRNALGAAVIPPSNAARKNHVVTITGLSPATTYFYNVGTVTDDEVQGGGTTEHYFVTAPSVGTAIPFTAWVVGDSGDAGTDQIAVRNAMLAETGATPPDLFLHMGDIAYEDGTDDEFTSNHFAIYEDILRQTPMWPTLGNHEARSVNTSLGTGPYYEAHVLPTGGEAGGVPSGTEAYYSFDYANVHFIVLASIGISRSPGSPMLNWLQADLSGTAQQWVIAYFHHSPYTKGTHDSDSAADSGGRLVDMRENVLPILEAGGVDLVLGGHSHIYERSYPLAGAYGYGTFPNFATPNVGTLLSNGNILDTGDGDPSGNGAYQNGTVYVVVGHGGHSVGGPGGHPVMFFSEARFGSVLLDINGPILTVRNVRSTGAVSDTFSINKTGKADIVLRNTSTGAVAAWQGNGVNAPTTTGILGGAPTTSIIVGIGDVNGDGTNDIIFRNTSTGDVAVWLGNGVNAPTTTGMIAGALPAAWVIVGVGDLNGDGRDDIVLRNTSTGDVAVWLGNGVNAPTTTGVIVTALPAAWVIVGVGDVNGDGRDDMVLRNRSTGDVAVWLGNGVNAPTTTGVIVTALPAAWVIENVGDLNNDGTDDMVLRNTSTGDVAAWLGNGVNAPTTTGVIAGAVPLEWKIQP